MQSAGKRETRPPERYDPSQPYHINLPPSDFDLTMSETDDGDQLGKSTMSQVNTTQVLEDQDYFQRMFDQVQAQNEAIRNQNEESNRKFDLIHKSIERTCSALNEKLEQNRIDLSRDFRVSLAEMNEKFEGNHIEISDRFDRHQSILNKLDSKLDKNVEELRADVGFASGQCQSEQQKVRTECKQYTDHHIANYKRETKEELSRLTERVCLIEGQAARLAAVENVIQKIQTQGITSSNSRMSTCVPSPIINNVSTYSRPDLNNVFSSTVIHNPSIPITTTSTTNKVQDSAYRLEIPSTITSQEFSRISQPYNINQSFGNRPEKIKDVVPEFNGTIDPVHPEEFLEKLNNYFQNQVFTDPTKINAACSRLSGRAKNWSYTLGPLDLFDQFVERFRRHFWCPIKQEKVRNEFYRPYYHQDTSSLQEHTIDWVNKVRYLHPPIPDTEKIDRILSHYPRSISNTIRNLRLRTVDELINEISYYEYTSKPSNNDRNNQNAITRYGNEDNNGNALSQDNGNPNDNSRYRGRNFNSNYQHNSRNNNHGNNYNYRSNYQNSNRNENTNGTTAPVSDVSRGAPDNPVNGPDQGNANGRTL